MGAGNVALAFAHWASLDDRSFRVLCRMALVSMDNGNPPKYFAGRDDLAAALGKEVPAKPDDADLSPEAEAARKARASVHEIVRKAVARLAREGAIVSSGDARFKNRAEYSLHLDRSGQPQQSVAPVVEPEPIQPQQIVAPMPQQSVAPLTQQIVGTDPTDRCPLGVEEEPQEELIGISPPPPLAAPTKAKQMDEDFKAWYEVYPKHVSRGAAVTAYAKARKNGATLEDLLAGARGYAAHRKGQDPKYTKAPATWLNQECWTDDPNHTGEIDVDAILGKDYWTPGTPPEGLSVADEIQWKKDQRAKRNAERLEQAKAKIAEKPSPWTKAYHSTNNVPAQYAWANRPDDGVPRYLHAPEIEDRTA
ncbi:hypothetical protein [Arthrobacter sp. M4]|uniref:hypothetical protein n=1 Tax=Arthrobacter sp. M4 TaxID=218160 RepID=UPI001CDD763E|nr:hypothetical protein [Arthrobacter sp. M4]MCA4132948.1 hypothetical protein [Arthrobacter sp. M4]